MSYNAELIIRIVAAALISVLFGNGSVVAFNRTPASWFEDLAEDGSTDENGRPVKVLPPKLTEADEAGRQRLPSSPWKYAFTAYFGISGLWLAIHGGSLRFEISVLCVLFTVLLMATADQLYRTVPDQFRVMLAICARGFIGYYDKWWEQPAGALTGFGITLAVLLAGRIVFKAASIGGADIKFFTCMGLVAGVKGIVIIFILTTIFLTVYSLILIACGRGSLKDSSAMLPSACAAVSVYFFFLWNIEDVLNIILL